MRRAAMAVAIAGLGLGPCAWADGPMAVTDAWSRVTASAASPAVVYLTITDSGAADSLTAVSTPIAEKASLHQSKMVNGMMEMDPVASLAVAPGKPLVLSPDGYHVMLTGLKQSLDVGQHFPLTLTFAHDGTVTVEVTVEPMSYVPSSSAMSGMKM